MPATDPLVTAETGGARLDVIVADITNARFGIARVIFCCFSDESAQHHRAAFADLGLA